MRSKNLSLVSFVAMSFLITSCNRNSNESNSSDSGKVVETISIETGDSVKKQVPGSIFWYTQAEIDNYYSAPDWFPEDHTPMPDLVKSGDGNAIKACASCHLTSGLGHPESGNLAGLPKNYLIRQMNDYKSRARFEPSPMYQMAEAMTDEEIEEVSAWFAQLKPVSSSKVMEADSVIETKIHPRLMMRQTVPDGKMEALNGRLIEIPEDPHLVEMRDPRAEFVAFVPIGSIEKGKILATTGGGKTIVCSTCHGEDLKGTNQIPRLAGLSPDYMVRQLKAFKSGKRNGVQASQMTPSVQNLDESEMIAISAYLGSLKP